MIKKDAIIDNHTLLPFFAPFLLPERVKRLRENMVEGAYTTPLDTGIYTDQINALQFQSLYTEQEVEQS